MHMTPLSRFLPTTLAVAGLLAGSLGAAGAVQVDHRPMALSSTSPGAGPAAYAGQVDQVGQVDHDLGNVRVYTEGVDFSRPVGVVVRLHGDGAYEYHHPEYRLDGLAEIAAQHNRILVAPLTPDTGTTTWWRESEANADWLAGLMEQQVLPTYGVDRSDIWWMGYSGGAELLARELIVTEPQLVTGGAVMLGGGGRPWGGRHRRRCPGSRPGGSADLGDGHRRRRHRPALTRRRPRGRPGGGRLVP